MDQSAMDQWFQEKLQKDNMRIREEGALTRDEWEAIKNRYHHTCLRCGKKEPEIKLVTDHVIPQARGGRNIAENIQPLCVSCNARKHAKNTDYRLTSASETIESAPVPIRWVVWIRTKSKSTWTVETTFQRDAKEYIAQSQGINFGQLCASRLEIYNRRRNIS